jgi:hypothetical protein
MITIIKTNNMTKESTTLNLFRFKDGEGKPCCAALIEGERHVCPFLMTKNFGMKEFCHFFGSENLLFRRNGGGGTIEPNKECPLWKH